jgi:alkyl sulfatase BDS1-like metallo-beta-lactamase superfamily hydrolase
MASGKVEWALTLADDALLLDPDHAAARKTKNDALIALAESNLNVQKRNYLLSEYIMETDQGGSLGDKLAAISQNPKLAYAGISDNFVELMPLHVANRILAVSLNASESVEKDMIVGVQLTDVPKKSKTESACYDLHVRKGILEVSEQNPSKGEFIIVADKLAWKSLVLGKMTPQYAIENEYVVIAGADPEKFYAFMALFD